MIYSSSNKVYGELENIQLAEESNKYSFKEEKYRNGVDEEQPLDFHSPYGCSKGSADQYIRDYSRIYGLNTVVLRQSCIYGQRQFGTEDQGWLFHFLKKGIQGEPITIYGDGKQVRDVLYIDDLIGLYSLLMKNIKKVRGQVFNIGGGTENSLSLLQSISIIEELISKKVKLSFSEIRPGDQKIFISNNTKVTNFLGWQPSIDFHEGIKKLHHWIIEIIS